MASCKKIHATETDFPEGTPVGFNSTISSLSMPRMALRLSTLGETVERGGRLGNLGNYGGPRNIKNNSGV